MGDGSTLTRDPVCGKEVDTLRARAVGIFGGATYYFCSAECKAKFKDPRQTPSVSVAVERRRSGERPALPAEAEPSRRPSRAEPVSAEEPTSLVENPTPARRGPWLVVLLLFAVAGFVMWYAFKR